MIELEIAIESGLHARPAAAFVQLAASFSSRIEISNLDRGKGPVNAKSVISVLTLGVRNGDRIRLGADGEDGETALAALAKFVADGRPLESK
jgi:phosphotransferase system HPr (HPr) family protein